MKFYWSISANMPLVWLLLLADVLVSSLGSVFTKRFLAGNQTFFIAALLTYSLANLTWIFTLRFGAGQLARMGVLCDLVNCAAVVLLGVLVYGEALGPRHVAGLGFGILAMVLLGGG